MYRTVPELLAAAHGFKCCGKQVCFYCAAPCGTDHPASQYVQSSFTGRSLVASPGSQWVCRGCVLALREDCTLTTINGEVRHVPKGAMRAFSWVITAHEAKAASKTHMDALRTCCLDPPEPPFAVVLSDSGKTHQIYRGVVNHSRSPLIVTLEGEPITFEPLRLKHAIEIASHVAAAAGKPVLSEPSFPDWAARKVIELYVDGEMIVGYWISCSRSPLGRLAAWLTPRKEICLNEYPTTAS